MKKALILGLSVTSFGAAHANLISNGDFELPAYSVGGYDTINSGNAETLLPGWTLIGGTVAGIGKNYLGAPSQELDLSGITDNATTGIHQSIATTAGKWYKLSFDYFTGNAIGYGGGIDLSVDTNPLVTNLQSNASYTRLTTTYTFQAAGSSTDIKFMANNGNVSHIDNVDVEAVPEPFTLAIIGGSALAYFRKRKSS